MMELTQAAQQRLDHYLHQIRASLRSCPTLDPSEVERDVRDHIEAELGDCAEPASFTQLNTVLARLGSPQQWVPPEELPWWRRLMLHARNAPNDWRLPVLCFALLLLAFVLIHVYESFWFPFMVSSFVTARLSLTLAVEHDQRLSAQRWLIYPSLILVYLPILLSVMLWPIATIGIGDVLQHEEAVREWFSIDGAFYEVRFWTAVCLMAGALLGFWWFIVGAVLHTWPQAVGAVFYPFAEWFTTRWAKWLIAAGVLVFGLGAGTGAFIVF